MLIISLLSVVMGLVLLSVPHMKLISFRRRYRFNTGHKTKDTLVGQRKQIVAGLYLAVGVVGLFADVDEVAIVIAWCAIHFIAAFFMVDYAPRTSAPPKKQPPQSPYLEKLRQKSDEIYAFLSKPENAALKTRVMNNLTEGVTGRILVEQMGGKSYEYGLPFFEAMQSAVGRLEKDDLSRPPQPTPTGPVPRCDVVLVDPGDASNIQVVMAVMELARLDLKAAQEFVASLPATLVHGETQDQAELVRDVLVNIGATVELVALETPTEQNGA